MTAEFAPCGAPLIGTNCQKSAMERKIESLRASLTRVEEERDAMAKVLGMAARTFRKYEQLHRDKGTEEGTTRANSNMIIAQLCERAIADHTERLSRAAVEHSK